MAAIPYERTKEFVVTVENRPGTLAELARALAQANVNILGLDSDALGEFGTIRLVTQDPAGTERTLQQRGFKFRSGEVLTVRVPNRPGTIADAAERLARSGINIENLYGYASPGADEQALVLRVRDLPQAEKVLGQ